mmetsp:Transcript_3569/g.3930  ORF Transcript_3569/g.3930 Transcript_3569/m.3930 type:complete len:83 (-) Transcript_3569:374-622(-)
MDIIFNFVFGLFYVWLFLYFVLFVFHLILSDQILMIIFFQIEFAFLCIVYRPSYPRTDERKDGGRKKSEREMIIFQRSAIND